MKSETKEEKEDKNQENKQDKQCPGGKKRKVYQERYKEQQNFMLLMGHVR